jgi:transcriptional regulator with XRE-family HTH domain
MSKVAQSHNTAQNAPMASSESLGERLRRERIQQGMTQRDLANKVGVGVPHISKLEADRESPSDELLVRLADELGIDADELFVAARRLPESIVEELASDPAAAVAFLRTWKQTQPRGKRG